MEKENLIRPSLLSADFGRLSDEIEGCISLGISHIHFDVMDGTFVDNISFGEPVFKKLNSLFQDRVIFDVHLMTVNPMKQAVQFASLGAKEICIHFEALTLGDIPKLRQFREAYPFVKMGLAFSPETDVDELKNLLSMFDYVLVMSVVPGRGGQKFITGSEMKIAQLVQFRENFNLKYEIGVDGGINNVTGPLCVKNHVDWMVAGSYYFNSEDKHSCLNSLKG